jgi:predicted amidohydrolase
MAEPVPGPTTDRLGELASSHSLHIVAGVLELGEGRRVYDSAVLFAPNGVLLAKYRRRFLWTGERNYVTTGDKAMIVPTKLGNIGLLVGYDLCFPEACATFLDHDVDIAVCTASVFERLNFNATRLALARAMDLHCYFVYANAVGFHQFANMRYTGHSAICADPYFLQVQLQAAATESLGMVAQAYAEPVSLTACLYLEDLAVARSAKLPFKTDARFTLGGPRTQVPAPTVASKSELPSVRCVPGGISR